LARGKEAAIEKKKELNKRRQLQHGALSGSGGREGASIQVNYVLAAAIGAVL